MMNLGDDFLKGVVTEPRIDAGINHGDKVTQCS